MYLALDVINCLGTEEVRVGYSSIFSLRAAA
jgi:hypothetical protein